MLKPVKWSVLNSNQRDALIAQYVFKRTILDWREDRDLLMEKEDQARCYESIPPYTTNLDAAWKIVECFDEIIISKHIPNKYHCELWKSTTRHTAVAKTPQDAICIAALEAIGIEVDRSEQTANKP